MKSHAEPVTSHSAPTAKRSEPALTRPRERLSRTEATTLIAAGNQTAQRILLARAGDPAATVGSPDSALERDADRIGQAAMRGGSPGRQSKSGRVVLASSSAGSPLRNNVRTRAEAQLGTDLGGVRVHADQSANRVAAALGARAFTHGSDIWLGPGEGAGDVALLAHEAAHVVQQQDGGGAIPVIQRQPTLESVGLPTAAEVSADESRMSHYLGEQSLEMLRADEQLSSAHPRTPEEREALRDAISRAVRLNALGLMASHRAHIEEARDRLEGRNRFPAAGEQPAQQRSSVLVDMREAADVVNNLQTVQARLENYRHELILARSNATFRRGSLNDTLHTIVTNGVEFMDEDLRSGLREGWAAAQQSHEYWLWAFGAANALEQLRGQQIAGIRLAISQVYDQFPLFAELQPSEVVSGSLASDEALLDASRAAYARVLAKVDDAIRNIATGDIDPLDLPKAVEVTRAGKPPEVQQALDEAVQRHEVNRFWLSLGLSALEIMLCFIPVVGPALALGVGAVALVMTLEDMLDRLTVARASTDPEDSPVGVQAPSGFEWAMAGVAAILAAFGGAGIARSAMRGFRAFQLVGEVAPALSAGSQMRLARMISRQPELIASPRVTAGLQSDLLAAGVELSPAELQALRAASYQAAGLPVPSSSAESLDSLLREVWRDQQAVLQRAAALRAQRKGPWRAVYSRYARSNQPNVLSMSDQDYLARIEDLRTGRPPGAVSNLQDPADPVNTFHRFERAGADLARIQQRIYINVNADQAVDVMEYIVRNIVDDPSVPGVQMAKLSGPGPVVRRADAIVIYLDDTAAVEDVLGRIRDYQQSNTASFRSGGPAMTEEALPGVTVGEEPTVIHGGQSFGQVRSNVIFGALEQTVAARGTETQFITRVRQLLRAAGINPDAPHLNLPPPQVPLPPSPSGGPPHPPSTPALLVGRQQNESED